MIDRTPPPHVQEAAKVVDQWLKSVQQSPPARRDMQADFAERLNYCRQFDQSKLPPWKDPRR